MAAIASSVCGGLHSGINPTLQVYNRCGTSSYHPSSNATFLFRFSLDFCCRLLLHIIFAYPLALMSDIILLGPVYFKELNVSSCLPLIDNTYAWGSLWFPSVRDAHQEYRRWRRCVRNSCINMLWCLKRVYSEGCRCSFSWLAREQCTKALPVPRCTAIRAGSRWFGTRLDNPEVLNIYVRNFE